MYLVIWSDVADRFHIQSMAKDGWQWTILCYMYCFIADSLILFIDR